MIAIKKILVPVDFSRCSKVALEHAIHFGNALNAQTIDVLHVWSPPALGDEQLKVQVPGEEREQTLAEFVRSKAGQSMKEFLSEVEQGGDFNVHGRLEDGDPQQCILDVASVEKYDLIVMGTHGVTRSAKLGSIAQKVVRNASCPVLTIRTMDPTT